MMLMNKKRKYEWILFLIVFFVGCCIGKSFNWGYFIIDKHISIIEAISLFVSVGCALYIAKTIEGERESQRFEKDIFIEQLALVERPLLTLEEKINIQSTYNDIIHSFASSKIKSHKLFERLDVYLNDTRKKQIIKYKERISSNLNELKPLLTNTPIAQVGPPDIIMKKGNIHYSQRRQTEIREKLQLLFDDFFAIKILINRG